MQVPATSNPTIEAELTSEIDHWLQHMTWRADFARWRAGRIWQEQHQDERLATMTRYAGPLQGRRILEIGSGMGGTSVALALAGAYPAATEYNPAYCHITQLRAARHALPLPVINAAGEDLPFDAQVFDLALCWDVVEHVQDPSDLLAELSRVIRPGGLVFLTVINRFAWRDPHYHLRAINYLPRGIAEAIIRRRGRSKAGSDLRDKQRLSEMHYFTYGQFRRLARAAWLSAARYSRGPCATWRRNGDRPQGTRARSAASRWSGTTGLLDLSQPGAGHLRDRAAT